MLNERKTVPQEEQETIINLSPGDKGRAIAYTCVPNMVKRLYQYASDYPGQVQILADDGYGVDASIPASWVTVKPRKKREMSEEQRQAAVARLAAARERKKNDP